jgi:hypothetical protein
MKKFLFITALALVSLAAGAQVQTPAASPSGSVSTTVGLTDVKIDYSLYPTIRSGEQVLTMVPGFLFPMM